MSFTHLCLQSISVQRPGRDSGTLSLGGFQRGRIMVGPGDKLHSIASFAYDLVREAQCELYLSRSAHSHRGCGEGLGDGAEGTRIGRRAGPLRRGVSNLVIIEDVEEIRTETEVYSLPYWELLLEGHVGLANARPTNCIS